MEPKESVLHYGVRWQRRLAATVSVLVVIGIATFAASLNGSVRSAFQLAVSQHPESYTELYLDNQTKLPTSSPAGKVRGFMFHITNHEGRTTDYRYAITMTDGEISRSVQTGSILLADSEAKDTPVTFVVPRPGLQVTITVTLPVQAQSVWFRTQS